jgi:hypothetical protein
LEEICWIALINAPKIRSIYSNKFAIWTVEINPNVKATGLAALVNQMKSTTYADTSYLNQRTKFNSDFFLLRSKEERLFIFVHEFRHLMKENNQFAGNQFSSSTYKAARLEGKGSQTAMEQDADNWAHQFLGGSCEI